jgi:PilZ domain-containing protein
MRQGGSAAAPGLNSSTPKGRKDTPLVESLRLKQITLRKLTKVPIGKRDDLTVDMLPRARTLSGTRGTMSNGRSEKRIARTVSVEVCLQDEPKLNERILTENVSAHGARVLMERKLQPGQQVLVSSPKEGVRSQARIVYCQRVSERGFAVGLELSGRVELWAKAY